jgi:hypothetical protein
MVSSAALLDIGACTAAGSLFSRSGETPARRQKYTIAASERPGAVVLLPHEDKEERAFVHPDFFIDSPNSTRDPGLPHRAVARPLTEAFA